MSTTGVQKQGHEERRVRGTGWWVLRRSDIPERALEHMATVEQAQATRWGNLLGAQSSHLGESTHVQLMPA